MFVAPSVPHAFTVTNPFGVAVYDLRRGYASKDAYSRITMKEEKVKRDANTTRKKIKKYRNNRIRILLIYS